ncbi:MAG: hypothetical protein WD066_20010 [Planctomycetaceae bacterium]
MKREQRHELHTHELQEWSLETKLFLERYATPIIVAVCAVLLLTVGIWAWRRNVEQRTTAAWARLSDANSAEQYAEIADEFSGSEVAAWARLRESESHLQDGMQSAFSSYDNSRSSFRAAEAGFRKLLDGRGVPPMVRQRALFGLGTALEASSSEGALAPAIDAYQEIIDEFGEASLYGKPAKERIAALKSPQQSEFYAWFDKQRPKPRDRDLPADLDPRRHDLSRPPFGSDPFFRPPGESGAGAAPPVSATVPILPPPGDEVPADSPPPPPLPVEAP